MSSESETTTYISLLNNNKLYLVLFHTHPAGDSWKGRTRRRCLLLIQQRWSRLRRTHPWTGLCLWSLLSGVWEGGLWVQVHTSSWTLVPRFSQLGRSHWAAATAAHTQGSPFLAIWPSSVFCVLVRSTSVAFNIINILDSSSFVKIGGKLCRV